jgi:UDP-glucose 4-epimerase
MSRVAVVTGGTRGIGGMVSEQLKEKGYTVAAVYGGNDEAAEKFKNKTGISVYKIDVSDFDLVSARLWRCCISARCPLTGRRKISGFSPKKYCQRSGLCRTANIAVSSRPRRWLNKGPTGPMRNTAKRDRPL